MHTHTICHVSDLYMQALNHQVYIENKQVSTLTSYLQTANEQPLYQRPSGTPYRSLKGRVLEAAAALRSPSSVWNATVLGVMGFIIFGVPDASEYCHSVCDRIFSHSCSSSRAVSGEYSGISVSSTLAARASFSSLVGTQECSDTSSVIANSILANHGQHLQSIPHIFDQKLTVDTTSQQSSLLLADSSRNLTCRKRRRSSW